MSREALGGFYAQVLEDRALQENLKAGESRDEFIARVVALGAQRGFDFTPAEVEVELARAYGAELSEAQLEVVAGGMVSRATMIADPNALKQYA